MNTIVLIGRMVKDPEIRYTPSGIVLATFSIAVDRPGCNKENKKTDFINCVAWRGQAEFMGKNIGKGARIAIKGILIQENYEKEGVKKSTYKIQCDSIDAIDWKDNSNSQQNPQSAPVDMTVPPPSNTDMDGELPF